MVNQGRSPGAASPRRSVSIGSNSTAASSGATRRISLWIATELTRLERPPALAGIRHIRPTTSQLSV